MSLNERGKGAPASVSITWEDAEGKSAEAWLEDRLETLPKGLPGFALTEKGARGEVAFAEYTLSGGRDLTQLLMARRSA